MPELTKNQLIVRENMPRTQTAHDFLEFAETRDCFIITLTDKDGLKKDGEPFTNEKDEDYRPEGFAKAQLEDLIKLFEPADEADRIAIKEFNTFLKKEGYALVTERKVSQKSEMYGYRVYGKIDDLLYKWIGVDGKAFEREREAAINAELDRLRKSHGA